MIEVGFSLKRSFHGEFGFLEEAFTVSEPSGGSSAASQVEGVQPPAKREGVQSPVKPAGSSRLSRRG